MLPVISINFELIGYISPIPVVDVDCALSLGYRPTYIEAYRILTCMFRNNCLGLG